MEDIILKLKALSDENRIEIIKLLSKYDFCVRALSARLDITEAAVSQHLKILREAELIFGEKRGYYTHYHVKKEALSDVCEYIDRLAGRKIEKLDLKRDS